MASALNTRSPSQTEADLSAEAAALHRLCGTRVRGRFQAVSGTYGGPSLEITAGDLASHLSGDHTVAVQVVQSDRCRLLAFDVDVDFRRRCALIAKAIDRRGLAEATIATSGSDPGRGKVLLFFARDRATSRVRSLKNELLCEIRASPEWGAECRADISAFPTSGEGGLLRIGGRNNDPRRRALTLDKTFSIYGEPRTFADVVPAKRLSRPTPMPIDPPRSLPRWLLQALTNGITYAGGSRAVRNAVWRAACAALTLHGASDEGHKCFLAWIAQIRDLSPDLDTPSPTTRDKRNPLRNAVAIERAWAKACSAHAERIGTLHTSPPKRVMFQRGDGGDSNVPTSRSIDAQRVLYGLEAFVIAKGLRRALFATTYRSIADFAGIASTSAAFRAVQKLVDAGLLVRHDRGAPGEKGLPTIFGLISADESPADVLRAAESLHDLQYRRRIVAEHAQRKAQARRPAAAISSLPISPAARETRSRPTLQSPVSSDSAAVDLMAYARQKLGNA